jgi:hypothetical protein
LHLEKSVDEVEVRCRESQDRPLLAGIASRQGIDDGAGDARLVLDREVEAKELVRAPRGGWIGDPVKFNN